MSQTESGSPRGRRRRRLLLACAVVVIAAAVVVEARTSWLQSQVFAAFSRGVDYEVGEGPSPRIRFPEDGGPYDERLGYTRIPALVERLEERGFRVVEQARVTPRFADLVDRGLHPPYEEKTQTGLRIRGRSGDAIFDAGYPERTYASFDSVPALVWGSLLFVENRELLSGGRRRNPAVEWDRLLRSLLDLGLRELGREGSVAGASTLATQIVKFRHWPGGRTSAPIEKLEQMASASLRAYSTGVDTREARKAIIVEYLNSVPLAASPGFGEIVGLGDALWAWYGADFASTNEALRSLEAGADVTPEAALAYRRVLSLLLAQRLPTFYLARPQGREALERRTERHLGMLAEEGALSPRLAEAALEAEAGLLERAPEPAPDTVPASRKVATSLRSRIATLLGIEHLYALDRFDLAVETTVDGSAQAAVIERLRSLSDPDTVRALGWDAPRLLGGGDPADVVYTVLLQELEGSRGAVRVQADNFRGPFDLNEDARLELGSTAKLRTLITYLEIVERLHGELSGLPADSIRRAVDADADAITRWAAGRLAEAPDTSLADLLEAAMERRYSANPAETFFTGGGSHRFSNFDRTFDDRVLSVREGFVHSVNLVFVRLMRDVERFYRYRVPGSTSRVLEDVDSPLRQRYLERFADREGRIFVRRFYRQYEGLESRDTILAELVGGKRPIAIRMARAFRFVDPAADTAELAAFLAAHVPGEGPDPDRVRTLYEETDPDVHDLPDLGYLTRLHPLELWVARHLHRDPGASLEEVLEASTDVRQEVYGWLFRSARRSAQDRRIRILLEIEAFLEIQREWRELGYPFANVVPSYGSSIGSSGDRPSALAELVGILLADGVRVPAVRVTRLRFAPGTPYETVLEREAAEPERVLSEEVASVARRALVEVVERGTAVRARGAFPSGDTTLAVGGKTGTGDNQVRIFGPGGRLVDSRPLNRTATFVFTAGDRSYGVVTAHVPGRVAGRFGFTSALPVHVFRWLAPVLSESVSPP